MKSRLRLADQLSHGTLTGKDLAEAQSNPIIRAEADRLRAKREEPSPSVKRKTTSRKGKGRHGNSEY